MKLRLADNTFTAGLLRSCALADRSSFTEVKGFATDDARVKIQGRRRLCPFKFLAINARAKKNGGGWEVEEF